MWWLYWVVVVVVTASSECWVRGGEVTYDGRSLIVGGERKILFSGSIHYPRSTPEVGLLSENLQIYKEPNINKVEWNKLGNSGSQLLTWYKIVFDAPIGNDPVTLNLSTMGKCAFTNSVSCASILPQNFGKPIDSTRGSWGRPSTDYFEHHVNYRINP